MTFRHGQSAVVLWDEYDLSQYLNNATISASMDPAEVTNFASGCDREYIKGLRDVTFVLDGFHSVGTTEPSTEITDVLNEAFTGSTSPVVTIGLENDTIGRRAWLLLGDIVGYDIDVPVDDVITTSVDLQGRQGYYGGVWLRDLSQATTDAVTAAVDSGLTGGGTTGGGVAHLHVTAITASTAVVVVQHSTSGSTWADLVTFSDVNAAGFQRSTVSGTVKEQLRSSITVSSGAVTAAVAFARYGPHKG